MITLYLLSCIWLSTLVYGSSPSGNAIHGHPGSDAARIERREGEDDPISAVSIVYPLDNAIESLPVTFTAEVLIRPGTGDLFNELYSHMGICFEVNNALFSCLRGRELRDENEIQTLGRFVARVFLSDVDDEGEPVGRRYWVSSPVAFTVVGDAEFDAHIARYTQERQNKYRPGYNLSLVDWALQQQSQRSDELLAQLERETVGLSQSKDEEMILLIGVKTAVETNFALRQAIRETWGSKEALPEGVKVLFIGCRTFSNFDEYNETENEFDAERRRLRDAIELEKMVYGDLLTDELNCVDQYLDLTNKVKEFLHVAASQYSRAQYVMIADDDLYVRTEELVAHLGLRESRTRYYSGQVQAIRNVHKVAPIRNTSQRYSLSETQFPLSELPPFAIGAYFFLSMDCVEFISKNRHRLRDLGGMDDISVALWMMSIQVHPRHAKKLGFLRSDCCRDELVAFGDLSPLAIRDVHDNLLGNRPFCHGFGQHLWLKSSAHAPAVGEYTKLQQFQEELQFDFALGGVRNAGLIQVVATVSTAAHAGIKVSFSPSEDDFFAFSRRVCAESRLHFPSAVNSISCTEIASQLAAGLETLFQHLETSK
ncbi:hypothetical protein V7S43_016178 [Phytophthora oleae]|uniref:Hexosyltransferase n=1 Tax=Phytophthora oleae TaxID=2107226 RepID=A0ABD3F0H4_9STRA